MLNGSKSFYKDKKILITGGLGFIGSNLSITLVGLGAQVTIIDSLITDYGGNMFNIDPIKSKVKVNISDVRDKYSINSLVKDQDILFNLAGTLSHVDSMTDPFTDLEINCTSQLSILEACRINNPDIRIIYSGTRNQYGRAQYLPVNESHPLNPTDINGINCNAGEGYHILYHQVYGMKTASVRLTNTYGPRHQMKHPRQGVLNWFLRQLIDHEEVKLYGTGEQIRDINYVDDVVSALLSVGSSDEVWGEVYNIGGSAVSLKEFLETAIKCYGEGKYKVIKFPEDREKIEIGNYVADYTKLKNQTGWTPEVDLKSGLKKTFQYYEKHKSHYW